MNLTEGQWVNLGGILKDLFQKNQQVIISKIFSILCFPVPLFGLEWIIFSCFKGIAHI